MSQISDGEDVLAEKPGQFREADVIPMPGLAPALRRNPMVQPNNGALIIRKGFKGGPLYYPYNKEPPK